MYIKQVIDACDTLYPNPYTAHEKYTWCDELSEMLTLKYNAQYEKTELSKCVGSYELPEGVSTSMLDRIIYGDKVIRKSDFDKVGIFCRDFFGRGKVSLPENSGYKRVYAVYIVPHKKIRDASVTGEITYGSNYFLTEESIFVPGDILNISCGDANHEELLVTACTPDESTKKIKVTVCGAELPEGIHKSVIAREITEKTVCPPPYDSMYIDYVLAKVCYYQNDFVSGSNHLTLFNAKLEDYANWVKSHPVAEYPSVKLRNWW